MNGELGRNGRWFAEIVAGWNGLAGDLAVCVPFPYLAQAQSCLASSRISWGSQDASAHASGAYTGEVSAVMLREFGCRYAIVGHSERRQYHAEDDALVARKAEAVLAAGITPIVCVGETLAEREAGRTAEVVMRQWNAVGSVLGEKSASVVVAYEPVWAIGTGRTASPDEAQEVHALLRGALTRAGAAEVPILYGGSVKAANAPQLFAMPDIDGGLIGGASLDAAEFLAIGRALDRRGSAIR